MKPHLVQIAPFDETGDVHYRVRLPMKALAERRLFKVTQVDYRRAEVESLAESADLLILVMLTDPSLHPLLVERRRAGRPTIFEINDHFEAVQPWNPAYPAWRNPETQSLLYHLASLCDAVQVTSAPLKAHVERKIPGSAVFLTPNFISRSDWIEFPAERPRAKDQLHIGWGGSLGHLADVAHCARTLSRWIRKEPRAILHLMGNDYCPSLFDIPPGQLRFTPWSSFPRYLNFLDQLDVGVIFQTPSLYNDCRSDVKFLEYASRGVAIIGPDTTPYREILVHHQTGLRYAEPDELIAHLKALLSDSALLSTLSKNAHSSVALRLGDREISDRTNQYAHWLGRALVPAGACEYEELLPDPAHPRPTSEPTVRQLIQQKRYPEALKLLVTECESGAFRIRAHLDHVRLSLLLGRGDALSHFESLIDRCLERLEPDQRIYARGILDLIERMGEAWVRPFHLAPPNSDSLLTVLEKASRLFPDAPRVWHWLGALKLQREEYDAAGEDFQKEAARLSVLRLAALSLEEFNRLEEQRRINAFFLALTASPRSRNVEIEHSVR